MGKRARIAGVLLLLFYFFPCLSVFLSFGSGPVGTVFCYIAYPRVLAYGGNDTMLQWEASCLVVPVLLVY